MVKIRNEGGSWVYKGGCTGEAGACDDCYLGGPTYGIEVVESYVKWTFYFTPFYHCYKPCSGGSYWKKCSATAIMPDYIPEMISTVYDSYPNDYCDTVTGSACPMHPSSAFDSYQWECP